VQQVCDAAAHGIRRADCTEHNARPQHDKTIECLYQVDASRTYICGGHTSVVSYLNMCGAVVFGTAWGKKKEEKQKILCGQEGEWRNSHTPDHVFYYARHKNARVEK
jgi:hypothetical protein